MVADPEPDEAVFGFDGQGAVAAADSGRPIAPDFLEHQRGMPRISLEQFEIPVCQLADAAGQEGIGAPEGRRRKMHQRGLLRPAR